MPPLSTTYSVLTIKFHTSTLTSSSSAGTPRHYKLASCNVGEFRVDIRGYPLPDVASVGNARCGFVVVSTGEKPVYPGETAAGTVRQRVPHHLHLLRDRVLRGVLRAGQLRCGGVSCDAV